MKWAWLVSIVAASVALADERVDFRDPKGDDNGPGTFSYPSDPAFKRGSFDLTAVTITRESEQVRITLEFNATLEDAWKTGAGFSLQSAVVFIGSGADGHLEGLPGLNVAFDPSTPWSKAVLITPLPAERVASELKAKAGVLAKDVVVPTQVRGKGRRVEALVDGKALPTALTSSAFQVVVGSADGFASPRSLLWRAVSRSAEPQTFGGGHEGECDPNVLDILAGGGAGDESEVSAQRAALSFECKEDGTAKRRATLKLIAKQPRAP